MSEYQGQGVNAPLQACFTRLGGQGAGSGWQVLNASPRADSGMIAAFGSLQNGNVKFLDRQRFDAEDATDLTVTELRVDGGWAFLTRIRYGLSDELGRPRLFSHGFAFGVDELAHRPNAVLAVTYDNFAYTSDETATPPQRLRAVPERSLRSMLDAVGLDAARYRDLVYALYSVLVGGARTSLTILCDCAEDTIRAVMGCLYAALPYALRGSLTFSTYATNPGSPTTVLFARPGRPDCRKTFDLATGTGSAISGAVRARFAKYGIASFAAEHIDGDLDAHYAAISGKLAQLGEETTKNLAVYDLADALLREDRDGTGYGVAGTSHSVQDATTRLNDVIGLYAHGGATPYRDALLTGVLKEMLDAGYPIPEQIAEPMCRVLAASTSPQLTRLYERYILRQISAQLQRSPLAAAQEMARMMPDRGTRVFEDVRSVLKRNRQGLEVLDLFYADVIGAQLYEGVAAGRCGRGEVESYSAEIREHMELPHITARLMGLCRLLGVEALAGCSQMSMSWLNDTMGFWERVMPYDRECVARLRLELLDRYWSMFDYATFDWDRGFIDQQLYRNLVSPDVPRSQAAEQITPLYGNVLACFVNPSTSLSDALDRLNAMLDAYAVDLLSDAEIANVRRRLLLQCDNLQLTRHIYDDVELVAWLTLWRALDPDTDVIAFLLNHPVDAMSPETVGEALRLLKYNISMDWYRLLERAVTQHADAGLQVTDAEAAMRETFKAEARQDRRQERLERRQEAKMARQARKSRGFGGDLRSMFGGQGNTDGDDGDARQMSSGQYADGRSVQSEQFTQPPQPPQQTQAAPAAYTQPGQAVGRQWASGRRNGDSGQGTGDPPSFPPPTSNTEDFDGGAGGRSKGLFGGLFGRGRK